MRVVIESPYSGGGEENIQYAQRCLWDSLLRGESPFASHLLYTQVLDDTIPRQRSMGMDRALPWYECAELCAVYIDRGITQGMKDGISYAKLLKITVVERTLKDDSQTSFGDSFTSCWGG